MKKITFLLLFTSLFTFKTYADHAGGEEAATEHAGHEHDMFGGMLAPKTAKCKSYSDTIDKKAYDTYIRPLMSLRYMRMHHALWHLGGENLSKPEEKVLVDTFGDGVMSPHPHCPLEKTLAGEDFLFMHHEMLGTINRRLIKMKQPCISGWDKIPEQDDKKWPVPDFNPRDTGVKSQRALTQLQNWEKTLSDPAVLKNVSLGELGTLVEFSVHNSLHMRFATNKPPIAGDPNFPLDGKFPEGWKYDDSKYDWLGTPYGAHVNPMFWKVHGYVDKYIDKWLDANKDKYTQVSDDCSGKSKCYEWKGMWQGANMRRIRQVVEEKPEALATTDSTRGAVMKMFATKQSLLHKGVLTKEELDKMEKQKGATPAARAFEADNGGMPADGKRLIEYVKGILCSGGR